MSICTEFLAKYLMLTNVIMVTMGLMPRGWVPDRTPALPQIINQSQQLRIGYWSTSQIECGIAMYSEHQVDALNRHGYPSFIYSSLIRGKKLLSKILQDKINVFNIQYESKIMPPTKELSALIRLLRAHRIKVILTIHEETADVVLLAALCSHIIYHKRPQLMDPRHKKVNIIPMGVPSYNPFFDSNKNELRKKYGFSSNNIIISTVGFMLSNKRQAEILNGLVPFLKTHPKCRIQLLTSFTRRALSDCHLVNAKIKAVIAKNKLSRQVVHVTRYLSQLELNERLSISDYGFLWVDSDTMGTSASTKEFISSRVPLLISDSSHFHDMHEGVLKVSGSVSMFVQSIQSMTTKRTLLERLRRQLVTVYDRLNYDDLIKQYIQVFKK